MANEELCGLIERCRTGDLAARQELFERYRAYLHVIARTQLGRHLQGKCDSSDVVQQTLLEAHKDFAGFQGVSEPELLAWLRRILSHNLFNETRRYSARQRDLSREVSLDQVRAGVEHSSVALGRNLATHVPTPSQQVTQRETAVQIARALEKLPEDYQTVVTLRIFEELPAEEVAQRMGRTAGAVRMLQMRALVALREALSES